MADEERPVHLVHDFATGKTTSTPVTDEEWEQMKANDAAQAEEARKAAETDAAFKAEVEKRDDALLTEIARRAGLL